MPTIARGSVGMPAQAPCAGHHWTPGGFLQLPRRMRSQTQMRIERWDRAWMVHNDLTSFEIEIVIGLES